MISEPQMRLPIDGLYAAGFVVVTGSAGVR